jgi:hypothetical protein
LGVVWWLMFVPMIESAPRLRHSRWASSPFEGLELIQALGNWEKGILIQRCIDVFSALQFQMESKLSWRMGAIL